MLTFTAQQLIGGARYTTGIKIGKFYYANAIVLALYMWTTQT